MERGNFIWDPRPGAEIFCPIRQKWLVGASWPGGLKARRSDRVMVLKVRRTKAGKLLVSPKKVEWGWKPRRVVAGTPRSAAG